MLSFFCALLFATIRCECKSKIFMSRMRRKKLAHFFQEGFMIPLVNYCKYNHSKEQIQSLCVTHPI